MVDAVGGTTNTSASSATSGTSNSASASSMDYDSFLKLLIAQMKNQDPLNPIDSTEYVSQLATFSNVEQAIKQNAKLDQILIMSNLAQANSAIGKYVLSADGTVYGQIVAVETSETGATAHLTDGNKVELGPGVTITA
jgi:flagellar basal-body rod modification protein FlgD